MYCGVGGGWYVAPSVSATGAPYESLAGIGLFSDVGYCEACGDKYWDSLFGCGAP